MKKKRKKQGFQKILIILLLMVFILLLVFSRGYRAARRAYMQGLKPLHEQEVCSVDSLSECENADGVNKTVINNESHKERIIMKIPRKHLLGFISPESDNDFVLIDPAYANRSGMYMRTEAYDAFLEMRAAALADDVTLTILSATRSFDHQKRIWENKWHGRQQLYGNILATDIDDPEKRALEILRFSAMPGTSRHHWGTDIDLNSLVNSYFEAGTGKRVYEWLIANAADYGFCQPYTRHGNNRTGGYEEEKWHWSYMPIASHFLEAFEKKITYDDINGFAGSDTAHRLRVIERFVMDVNKKCR